MHVKGYNMEEDYYGQFHSSEVSSCETQWQCTGSFTLNLSQLASVWLLEER
jgi:hypothetical protein